MTKTKLWLSMSILTGVLVIGMFTLPALAAQNTAGGGQPRAIVGTPKVFDSNPADDIIDRVIIQTKGKISTTGGQGLVGYALLTDTMGVALAATSHAGFYDNIGAGSGPGAANCAAGALVGASYVNPALGTCTFKLLCQPGDNCGPEWHLHYATVAPSISCPGGFQIQTLSHTQPGNVFVQGNKLIISNLDKTPGAIISALPAPGGIIGNVNDLDFNSLTGFAPLSITAIVEDNNNADPTDDALVAACLTPVSGGTGS